MVAPSKLLASYMTQGFKGYKISKANTRHEPTAKPLNTNPKSPGCYPIVVSMP